MEKRGVVDGSTPAPEPRGAGEKAAAGGDSARDRLLAEAEARFAAALAAPAVVPLSVRKPGG